MISWSFYINCLCLLSNSVYYLNFVHIRNNYIFWIIIFHAWFGPRLFRSKLKIIFLVFFQWLSHKLQWKWKQKKKYFRKILPTKNKIKFINITVKINIILASIKFCNLQKKKRLKNFSDFLSNIIARIIRRVHFKKCWLDHIFTRGD